MFTTKAIYSHTSNDLYAPYGVEVTLVSNHGDVMIVEYGGIAFPCRAEYLSDDVQGGEVNENNEFRLL